MRLSPEDNKLRKKLRELAWTNLRSPTQKVIFLDHDLDVAEVVYAAEINSGGHIKVRDRLLREDRLRAILQLGLVAEGVGYHRVYIHVVDEGSAIRNTHLLCLRQSNERLYWVPPPGEAQDAWSECWFPDQ